jgi:hypothetical protein
MPHSSPLHPSRNDRRALSLAQSGLGPRLAIAVALVLLVWAAILPLVL